MVCNAVIAPNSWRVAHPFLCKSVDALIVRCPNYKQCNWKGTRTEHALHIKNCSANEFSCDYASKGCVFKGTKDLLQKHLESQCKFAPLKIFFADFDRLTLENQNLKQRKAILPYIIVWLIYIF